MTLRLEQQAQEVHQVMTELVKTYQFRNRQEICCYGISVSQCYTLYALDGHDRLTMGQLAKQMHLTVSTMTRVVDQLVAKRLVRREFRRNDRRVCCVQLTQRGRTLLEKIRAAMLESEEAILRQMKPENRETLISALKELSKALDRWKRQDG